MLKEVDLPYEIHHGELHYCVTARHGFQCEGKIPSVLSQMLAADIISLNFDRQTSLAEVLANFMGMIHGDDLRSGFSGYSAETCYAKYMGKNSCPALRSITDMCSTDEGIIKK